MNGGMLLAAMLATVSVASVASETARARVPPMCCVEWIGTNGFHVTSGHSAIVFELKAAKGLRFCSWTFKRIRMALEDDKELTTGFPSVTVALLDGERLYAHLGDTPPIEK